MPEGDRTDGLDRRAKGAVQISVVIPARDEEKLLPLCLESLKRQSFRGTYEIIVVDNNSRDRTADVARAAGAQVVLEPHRGITWARQRGLEAARGEIIACTDADSTVGPRWLETIWNALARDPGAVAIGGQVYYDKGKGFGGNLPRWFGPLVFSAERLLCRVAGKPGGFWGANFAARRSALIEAGGFNRAIDFHGEDAELAARLRPLGRILFDSGNAVRTSPRRYEGGGALRTAWRQLSASAPLVVAGKAGGSGRARGVVRPRRIPVTGLALGAILLGLASMAVYFAVNPASQVFGAVAARGAQRQEKVVALSFDDGPDEPYTSEILAILGENRIKATFFVIGANAEAYPETVGKIARAGHVLANHTYRHSYLLPFQSAGPVRDEVDRTEDIIFGLTGLRTCLFRPPHGLRTPWYIHSVKDLHYRVVTWTDMTNDYSPGTKPEEIVRRIVARAHPGDIIDLHDGRDTIHGVDRSNTVKALPAIIDGLKKRGYSFETVPELLHVPAYKGESGR